MSILEVTTEEIYCRNWYDDVIANIIQNAVQNYYGIVTLSQS